MKDWSVRLVGDKFDLEELPSHFDTPELFIYCKDEIYYMKSDEFKSIDDAGKVRSLAHDKLSIINGTLKLSNSSFNSIGIHEIFELNDKGGRDLTVVLGDTINLRDKPNIEITETNGTVNKYFPSIKGSDCVIASRKNKDIILALSLLVDDNLKWDDLYRIFELVEKNNGNTITKEGWTNREKSLFTQTANSFAAIGIESRHMKNDSIPPENPMTFSEAEELIVKLLRLWIQKMI